MFTGLISDIGVVAAITPFSGGMRWTISAPKTTAGLKPGDSVNVSGACQTTVPEGQPDHRDSYLSPAERRSGKTIMPCCSGSLTKDLVLDI